MKKLYTLKSWFSLGDAAERLGAGLGEGVSVNDVLQLVVEELLPLSWYIRHVPARRVAPYTALLGKGYSHPVVALHNSLYPDDDFYQKHLVRAKEWEYVDGKKSIVYLEGPYRLELKYCGALMDWIHAHLTNTGGELASIDGFFVSDNEGTIWQILEYQPRRSYKTSDGEKEEMGGFITRVADFLKKLN